MSIVSPRPRPRDAKSPSNGCPQHNLQAADRAFAFRQAKSQADWSSWQQALVARWRAASLPSLSRSKRPVLLWGIEAGSPRCPLDATALEMIARLNAVEKKTASKTVLSKIWSQRFSIPDPVTPGDALALVAWARVVPALAVVAEPGEWWTVVDRLVGATQTPVSERHDVWLRQLLAGELALTLGYWTQDLSSYVDLPHLGRASLEKSLRDDVDDDGFVHHSPREDWLSLLACWTRSRMLLKLHDKTLHADAAARFQDVAESYLRLSRRDGSLSLIGTEVAPSPARLDLDLWCAVEPFVDRVVQRTIATAFKTSSGNGRSNTAGKTPLGLLPPSANSERAALAVLRPSWSAPRLIADYRGPQIRIRLDRQDAEYFSGACDPSVVLDGRQLAPQSDWEESCWITDDDVDYLELQLDLTEDIRVQRHLLFARQDEFIFIADAVLGKRTADIRYQCTLPFGAAAAVEAATETRELIVVQGGRRRAVVLPLSLGEWRSDRRWGELSVEPSGVRLSLSAKQAQNLFAPWFIDLSSRRLSRPMTWRRLTVAEDRQVQPDDAAVGYRVQAGQQQWLFYRSLAACGNRTLLGHNLVSEFLAARFSRKGVSETLIEIEAPAADA